MPTDQFTAHVADPSELDTVIRVCLEAFADEAVMAWVMPDSEDRHAYMRESFATSLGDAVDIGAVILAVDHAGAAVAASIWVPTDAPSAIPATAQHVPDTPQGSRRSDRGHVDPVQDRLETVEAATRTRTPQKAHMYLTAMATLPRYRGRGAGTVMLAAGLGGSHARGLPVYLEASTTDNRRLYARWGFEPLGDPIHLPDGGPTLQPMWRGLGSRS